MSTSPRNPRNWEVSGTPQPTPVHRQVEDRPGSGRDAVWPRGQNPQSKPHRHEVQYSPKASSHTLTCSPVDKSPSGWVVMANGRSSRSSTCARKMLNASPGFIPRRAKTFSALRKRAVGTRARNRVVYPPISLFQPSSAPQAPQSIRPPRHPDAFYCFENICAQRNARRLQASETLQKGIGRWTALCYSSLPHFISPFRQTTPHSPRF